MEQRCRVKGGRMRRNPSALIQASVLCLLSAMAYEVTAQQEKAPSEHHPNLALGVLEDHPGEYAGEPNVRLVRAVFEKRGSEWRSFPNDCHSAQCLKSLSKLYPREVTWTVAFDGKNLGQITARTQPEFKSYSGVGFEEITNPSAVPTVGERSEKYSGFLFTPVYRPLVTVSQPNYRDPETWKTSHPSPETLGSVREQFRSRFPVVKNCKNPDENIPRPWKYRDEDIQVSTASSSKTGWSLVELSLTGWACDGMLYDTEFIGQWYVVEPSGTSRFLGTDMWLVDAGDYDGDAKFEVLFSIDGYNRGGYRLFYQDFSKRAEFIFFYH